MTEAVTRADVVVLGAGPKAAALASKAHVLDQLGYGPLRIVVVEQREVAASWTGRHGFTSGFELLGTRPEKDVGFPYQSASHWGPGGQEIDRLMMQFSWQSHLVEIREYRRWVDAGVPYPEHHAVAHYVDWVLARAHRCTELRLARVTAIGLRPAGWLLSCETAAGGREQLLAERGLVLTGPGVARPLACAPEVAHRVVSPAATTAETRALEVPPGGRICIVGSGESAVSLALGLIREFGEGLRLTFVAPSLPLTRVESFLENAVYSDPQLVGWRGLAEADRQEFIRRTDRGVMSPDAVARLARHRHLDFVLGRVREVARGEHGCARVTIDPAEEGSRAAEPQFRDFDLVANCMGSCLLTTLLDLLGEAAGTVERRLGFALRDKGVVQRALDATLALAGLTPRLHLPALAGLVHGPGVANLSCLSSLSDHILSAYLGGPLVAQRHAAQAALCTSARS